MGDKSSIEWTDATWNPVTGCSKVSQGCKHCYAERVFPRPYPGRAFTDVRTHADRLEQPLRWQKPRRIFVNSMSDLFHEDIPLQFIADVFAVMACTTRHTYQVLTKRPERMVHFFQWLAKSNDPVFNFPKWVDPLRVWPQWTPAKAGKGGYDNCGPVWPLTNVWLGVSVEDQATADERIPLLLKTPAAVRFLSCEPLLGPVDMRSHLQGHCPEHDFPSGFCLDRHHDGVRHIGWIIAGGESGPKARPSHPDWFRSLRDQCAAASVAFFFKQWGEYQSFYDREREDPDCRRCKHVEDASPLGQWLNFAGGMGFSGQRVVRVDRIGKKRAGRLLDGRTHDEYPA